MITGFGNNVVSALAADITANQTTIQVMPGTGKLFAGLLTCDYANPSNSLRIYAKITLTDAKETVFEVCHLMAVSNDILTVVRAQEGTKAKGWSLNDVIGNFATRGSENQFVQIEQLQSGQYLSGTAGGTANALTLELPATYFVNGSNEWVLRTPVAIYPTQTNTGASTLQLIMGGRPLGTFPLYKGDKIELAANDILAGNPFVCLLDHDKSFFTVMNPGRVYGDFVPVIRKVNGHALNKDIDLTAGDVGAVSTSGGSVDYLDGATHFQTDPSVWSGAGAFADQYSNGAAPFLVPRNYKAGKDASTYLPVIKGFSETDKYGYGVSVSFGIVRSGKEDFGSGCVHVIGDNGSSQIWTFESVSGDFRAHGGNIVAGRGVYDNGGNRVYSASYPPPVPTAQQVGAVPSSGGSVAYLDNANYYAINGLAWPGAGGFADQYNNATAPFIKKRGYATPKDGSWYSPLVKGLIQTEGYGFGTAISFGALSSGEGRFASGCIHVIGDNGSSQVWEFSPETGNFTAHGGKIIAGLGVYDNGGNRVYSASNPPPRDIPTGVPVPWPSPTPPSGWTHCNGSAFNTTSYPELAAAYPSGTLPDLRGVFIRGWDNGRGIDSGRGILTQQAGQSPVSCIAAYAWPDTGVRVSVGTDNQGSYSVHQQAESARETRPVNVAFNYIVRAA